MDVAPAGLAPVPSSAAESMPGGKTGGFGNAALAGDGCGAEGLDDGADAVGAVDDAVLALRGELTSGEALAAVVGKMVVIRNYIFNAILYSYHGLCWGMRINSFYYLATEQN